jgi:Putative polyhydroxyalkanoic acid system protein (PHA_gran_rgn)
LRITVSHNKSKEEIIRSLDRVFDDLFRGIPSLPIQVVHEQRSWQGSTLTFSLSAKMGILRNRIAGTVEVTEKDVTIDVDLGLFERLIPETKAREVISSRIRGLLT